MSDLDFGAAVTVELEGALREEVEGTVLFLKNRVQEDSPVDSGWFRSEWRTFLGEAPDEPRTPRSEGDQPFYPMEGDDEALRALAPWAPGLDAGLYDNAPHAARLADGWSQQAEAGWLDTIQQEAAER